MPDWSTFYMVTAGAAATLMGLLFIGVQFNIEAFVNEPGSRWQAVARSTLVFYTQLFYMPLLFLIPGTNSITKAAIIFLVAGAGAVRASRTWLPVWRGIVTGGLARLWETGWLVLGPLIIYGFLGWEGWRLYRGDDANEVQRSLAYLIVALFGIAIRNSWKLLFELTYERKRQLPK